MVNDDHKHDAAIDTALRDAAFAARQPIFRTLEKESDRGCVLVAGAALDEGLARVIRRHLKPTGDRGRRVAEGILTGRGILSSAWAKAQFALAAGLIEDWTFDDLEAIRRLRNECAHNYVGFSFDNSKAREVVRELKAFDVSSEEQNSGSRLRRQRRKQSGTPGRLSRRAKYRLLFGVGVSILVGYLDGCADAAG